MPVRCAQPVYRAGGGDDFRFGPGRLHGPHGDLPPPDRAGYASSLPPPSSSGLGHRPFTAAARVRIPLGVLTKSAGQRPPLVGGRWPAERSETRRARSVRESHPDRCALEWGMNVTETVGVVRPTGGMASTDPAATARRHYGDHRPYPGPAGPVADLTGPTSGTIELPITIEWGPKRGYDMGRDARSPGRLRLRPPRDLHN